ncbi:MFS transporter [Dactylosporangium sp. NPDC005555]|uniref:MFS transporter n=1 Tax=Dactylosporangium sp. NPDC005555 TaxID=3154889 RepID=UPI0033A02AF9
MLEALRVRDFRLLWVGRSVSLLGSWLLTVAVPAHVLQLTGSLMATGLTLAAEYLPVLLLGPLAGALSDRWDRRRVMLATDVFRACAVAGMLLVDSPGTVWLVYAALAAESTGSALFRPAAQAYVPAIVGTGTTLSSANALTAGTDGIVRLIGAPLGAVLLLTFGFPTLIWIDAATYLCSALAIFLTAHRPVLASSRRRLREDLLDGLRVVGGARLTRWLLVVSTTFALANGSLSALLIPLGVTELGGPRQAGLVVSALGAGFLLGAPLIRLLVDRIQPRQLYAGSLLCTAAGFLVLFTANSLPVALPAAAGIGVFGSLTWAVPQTTIQRHLPNAVLGRVTAVFLSGDALATLTGAVAGPAVAQAAGLTALALAACTVAVAAAALALVTLPTLATLLPDPATLLPDPATTTPD